MRLAAGGTLVALAGVIALVATSDAGPVVRLTRLGVYAVARHAAGVGGVFPEGAQHLGKVLRTHHDQGEHAHHEKFGPPDVEHRRPPGARLAALGGANILFYPTAIGWHPYEKATHGATQRSAWQTIQRSHAIANGVHVASINRVGHEVIVGEGIEFWGASFVSDPFGVLLAKGSHQQEEVIIAECDPARTEEVRRNWPFLRDRRIDAYAGITQRYLA